MSFHTILELIIAAAITALSILAIRIYIKGYLEHQVKPPRLEDKYYMDDIERAWEISAEMLLFGNPHRKAKKTRAFELFATSLHELDKENPDAESQ